MQRAADLPATTPIDIERAIAPRNYKPAGRKIYYWKVVCFAGILIRNRRVFGIIIVIFKGTTFQIMIKRSNYIGIGIVFLTGILFTLSCDKKSMQETGFMEGVISIGPLCPVETDPPDPGCLPTAETYKAYPVSIWTSNGNRKIIQIDPALDGSYKIELEPGNYLVVLESRQNGIGSSNLPSQVTIVSRDKTIFNINIDTGIR